MEGDRVTDVLHVGINDTASLVARLGDGRSGSRPLTDDDVSATERISRSALGGRPSSFNARLVMGCFLRRTTFMRPFGA